MSPRRDNSTEIWESIQRPVIQQIVRKLKMGTPLLSKFVNMTGGLSTASSWSEFAAQLRRGRKQIYSLLLKFEDVGKGMAEAIHAAEKTCAESREDDAYDDAYNEAAQPVKLMLDLFEHKTGQVRLSVESLGKNLARLMEKGERSLYWKEHHGRDSVVLVEIQETIDPTIKAMIALNRKLVEGERQVKTTKSSIVQNSGSLAAFRSMLVWNASGVRQAADANRRMAVFFE